MKQASVDVFPVAWGLVFYLHPLSLPLTPSGSSPALTGGKVHVSHPVIPQPRASVTQMEPCADFVSCVVPQNSRGRVPPSSVAAPGRSWCSRVPVFLGCSGGQGRLKADAGSFISLANSWPVVRTDTSEVFFRAERISAVWFPAADHMDPVPGPQLPPLTASTRLRLTVREAPRASAGGLPAAIVPGQPCLSLRSTFPRPCLGIADNLGRTGLRFVPWRLHLGGDC